MEPEEIIALIGVATLALTMFGAIVTFAVRFARSEFRSEANAERLKRLEDRVAGHIQRHSTRD